MKKKLISLASFVIALGALAGGMATMNASAETNAEGWVLRDDGYYYEENPPVTDLYDFYTAPADDMSRAKRWYIVDYTGAMESGNFALGSNTDSTGSYPVLSGVSTIGTSQALLATYSSWGVWYPITNNQSAGGALSEEARHMDFTFMVDFTNLDGGYIAYRNHATKISIDIANNQVVVEEKQATQEWNWTWGNSHTNFLPFEGLNDLTGWQQVTVLIEDRVSESTADITRDGNKGAKVTVTIGDKSVTDTIEKMGYYIGTYAIENQTGTDLKVASTKACVTFEENGGDAVADKNVTFGSAIGELPTPTNKGYKFGGWYSSADFAEGTELTAESIVGGDMTAYARWIAPGYNDEGWKFDETDGYFYEENPPVMDLFEYYTPPVDPSLYLAKTWYIVDYTGAMESGNFTMNNDTPTQLTGENNVVKAGQALVAMEKSWGVWYPVTNNQSAGSALSESGRHMDFTFMVDFTNLDSGYIAYRNHATKISIDIANNQVVVEEKGASMNWDWSWTNSYTNFLSFAGLNDLTGWQQVTILIEDRVVNSTEDIKNGSNKGARVTVKIGDNSVTDIIPKMGYYIGTYAIENHTNADLKLASTKALVEFNSNGGEAVGSKTVDFGSAIGELPTLTKAAWVFGGWYSSADFAEGTELTAETLVNGNITAYAKWTAPVSPNADGWVFNEADGYFYEENPPVMDLFDWSFNDVGAGIVADWYVMDTSGLPETNNLTVSNRTKVSGGSVTLGYYQAMIAQYNNSIDQLFTGVSTGGGTNDRIRNMDFSVMIDFTNLTSGYVKYFYDSIMITIEFSSENIIVENREAALGYDYKSWGNSHCEFISVPGLRSLTGVHKVTFLIEDRVLASVSETTRDNNKGAKVSVILDDDMTCSSMVNKVGYYGGFFGFINYSQDLTMYSTKATVNYVENGGSDVEDLTVAYGSAVTLATEITKDDMTFAGWYTSEDFAEGTLVEGFDSLVGSVTVYAKWIISAEKKAEMIAALTEKYVEANYDAEDWAKMTEIIAEATASVDAVETMDEINEIIENADSKLAAYRTKADKELAAAKNAAATELDELLDEDDYTVDAWDEIQNIIATAKGELGAATTVEQVNEVLTAAKAALNAIETKPEDSSSDVEDSSSDVEDSSSDVEDSSSDIEDSSSKEPDSSVVPDDSSVESNDSSDVEEGCFGSIGGLSASLMVMGACALVLKKKKED